MGVIVSLQLMYTLEIYRLVARSERFTEVRYNDYVVVQVRTEDMINYAIAS